MKVWGLDETTIVRTLGTARLDTENICTRGRAVQFRMLPRSSRDLYARRSASGRHLRACCFHGFRDGITALFVAGATRVQTATDGTYTYTASGYRVSAKGDWTSLHEFRASLANLYKQNIGSLDNPCTMGDACDCETVGANYLTSMVKEVANPHSALA